MARGRTAESYTFDEFCGIERTQCAQTRRLIFLTLQHGSKLNRRVLLDCVWWKGKVTVVVLNPDLFNMPSSILPPGDGVADENDEFVAGDRNQDGVVDELGESTHVTTAHPPCSPGTVIATS